MFFASFLAPGIQAGANAKWLQITRWELIQLANDTEEGFNIIKIELRALRLMTMQNRYVLDLITAMDGGVCKKLGGACCTWVPTSDADNGTLSNVITAVHNLGQRMRAEGGVENSTWFDDMFNWVPSWMNVAVKVLTPIIVFLLLIFCVCQLGLRCCKDNMPSSTLMMVTMGHQTTEITVKDAQVQTGEHTTPRYRMSAIYRQWGDIVDNLHYTTIREPKDLLWYKEVWVDLDGDGGIYLMVTPEEYARNGNSLRSVCKAWMPIEGTPAWDESVEEYERYRRENCTSATNVSFL